MWRALKALARQIIASSTDIWLQRSEAYGGHRAPGEAKSEKRELVVEAMRLLAKLPKVQGREMHIAHWPCDKLRAWVKTMKGRAAASTMHSARNNTQGQQRQSGIHHTQQTLSGQRSDPLSSGTRGRGRGFRSRGKGRRGRGGRGPGAAQIEGHSRLRAISAPAIAHSIPEGSAPDEARALPAGTRGPRGRRGGRRGRGTRRRQNNVRGRHEPALEQRTENRAEAGSGTMRNRLQAQMDEGRTETSDQEDERMVAVRRSGRIDNDDNNFPT